MPVQKRAFDVYEGKIMTNEKNFKTGHRKRLRERYIKNGIDSLAEHEILEFLLFHSIPRVDTKPLAYRLLETYGSVSNVISASFDSLRDFGLSEISAAHICAIKDLYNWMRRNEYKGKTMTDYLEIGRIFAEELGYDNTERLVAMLLDASDRFIALETVSQGSFRSAKANMRELNSLCVNRNAAKVIIAHNHPSGDIRPSAEDHAVNAGIESFLSQIDVELVEHYIVAGGTFMGMKRFEKDMRAGREEAFKNNYGIE